MKILLVHNRYQLPGGEDEVYRRERELLQQHGHEIVEYDRDNREIAEYGLVQKAGLALRTTWAWDSYREIRSLIRKESPDLAHFHNTFPLISPAAYYACAAANVPVVQTLHNPRLLCPAATLFRGGNLCEECTGRFFAWPAIQHGCYQESRMRTAAVSSMLFAHRWMGTWVRKVDCYIASTEFCRHKFVEAGLPAEKVYVKPHFVDIDPGITKRAGEYALFIGRLAPEKGVRTMLNAWRKLTDIPLRVCGQGPLSSEVKIAAGQNGQITTTPRMSRPELIALLQNARFLVWPSEGYYETFGLVAIEAFACGVPVIASRVGVMQEIVSDGRTGLLFNPGDDDDMATKVQWAWKHRDEARDLGLNGRSEFETKYAPAKNYRLLVSIYESAINGKTPLPDTTRVSQGQFNLQCQTIRGGNH